MSESLGEALPSAIAKVSELIGRMEKQADEHDSLMPGMGNGTRMMVDVLRVHRDVALAASTSGDVVAMMAAYQQIKPALDLANADEQEE